MAYLTTLASVSREDLQWLTRDSTHLLSPSHSDFVSHYLAYSVQVEPLGHLLGRAIDGGDPINPDLWHPLRAPVFHSPDAVRELHSQIQSEWHEQRSHHDLAEDDWYRIEIEKVLDVFAHATMHDECVVNIIHPPADPQRASRVRMPIETPSF